MLQFGCSQYRANHIRSNNQYSSTHQDRIDTVSLSVTIKKEEQTRGWSIDFSIFHAVINLSVGYLLKEIIKMHMV